MKQHHGMKQHHDNIDKIIQYISTAVQKGQATQDQLNFTKDLLSAHGIPVPDKVARYPSCDNTIVLHYKEGRLFIGKEKITCLSYKDEWERSIDDPALMDELKKTFTQTK